MKPKNTAPGENTIHPQMIKSISSEILKYLLDMYNKIWKEVEIPDTWKHATITPLTNILCKTFEWMTRNRLV